MTDKVEKKEKKSNKDYTFSPSGILKEGKKVEWAKAKTHKENGTTVEGTLVSTAKVLCFTGGCAAFFILCDLLISVLSKLA